MIACNCHSLCNPSIHPFIHQPIPTNQTKRVSTSVCESRKHLREGRFSFLECHIMAHTHTRAHLTVHTSHPGQSGHQNAVTHSLTHERRERKEKRRGTIGSNRTNSQCPLPGQIARPPILILPWWKTATCSMQHARHSTHNNRKDTRERRGQSPKQPLLCHTHMHVCVAQKWLLG
uniref:Uncharacterized protein n=1 Tax=Vitrella brassicaformis TaxID=1169539 RepID=A0A7S1KAV7_9ALVE